MEMRPSITVQLRLATLVDLPAMVRIYNQSIPERNATTDMNPVTLEDRLPWFHAHTPRYPLWVADAEGTVAAWACISPFGEKAGYRSSVENSVYVERSWRGQGIGKQLLEKTVEESGRLGYHAIIARIFAHNPASIALHHAFGFEEMAYLKEVAYMDGNFYDVVYMVRLLG